jgi:hypothetical protein
MVSLSPACAGRNACATEGGGAKRLARSLSAALFCSSCRRRGRIEPAKGAERSSRPTNRLSEPYRGERRPRGLSAADHAVLLACIKADLMLGFG